MVLNGFRGLNTNFAQLNSEIENKITDNDIGNIGNLKFVIDEYETICSSYDNIIQRYTASFPVNKFPKYHTNTIAIIPLAFFNNGYLQHALCGAIRGENVIINSDFATNYAAVKVLMIQYDV